MKLSFKSLFVMLWMILLRSGSTSCYVWIAQVCSTVFVTVVLILINVSCITLIEIVCSAITSSLKPSFNVLWACMFLPITRYIYSSYGSHEVIEQSWWPPTVIWCSCSSYFCSSWTYVWILLSMIMNLVRIMERMRMDCLMCTVSFKYDINVKSRSSRCVWKDKSARKPSKENCLKANVVMVIWFLGIVRVHSLML